MTSVDPIPFHRADIGDAEVQAVCDVLRSGWLTMGPKTLEFESEFAKYVGSPFAVSVSSCTAALHLSLEAIGLKPGDEVILPTTTFTSTAEVVTYLGARPVLADISPRTMNIDVVDVERRITSRTRAIIPVHLAGLPCELDEINELANMHGIRVIEDAAHAIPAAYKGRSIGSVSEITAFSFYATKTLTTGEGGMVTTANEKLAQRMRMMRLHGIARDAWKRYKLDGNWFYSVEAAGFKYNLTDLQAALGIVQLARCESMRQARRIIAKKYEEAFRQIPNLQVPLEIDDRIHAWHLYILRIDPDCGVRREDLIAGLKSRGIGTSVHFIPLHLHPYYQQAWGYRPGDFPIAEAEYKNCLSLPLYPAMSEGDIQRVIEAIATIVRSGSGAEMKNERSILVG